jgi:hypothetical protein
MRLSLAKSTYPSEESVCSMLIHGENKFPRLLLAKSAWPSNENVCMMHMYLEYSLVLDQVT